MGDVFGGISMSFWWCGDNVNESRLFVGVRNLVEVMGWVRRWLE